METIKSMETFFPAKRDIMHHSNSLAPEGGFVNSVSDYPFGKMFTRNGIETRKCNFPAANAIFFYLDFLDWLPFFLPTVAAPPSLELT